MGHICLDDPLKSTRPTTCNYRCTSASRAASKPSVTLCIPALNQKYTHYQPKVFFIGVYLWVLNNDPGAQGTSCGSESGLRKRAATPFTVNFPWRAMWLSTVLVSNECAEESSRKSLLNGVPFKSTQKITKLSMPPVALPQESSFTSVTSLSSL